MAAAAPSQPFTGLTSSTGNYALHFSDTAPGPREPDRRFYSLRYNHKPKKPANSARKSTLNASPQSSATTLNITDTPEHPNQEPQDVKGDFSYSGAKLEYVHSTVPFALVYEPATNTFTLQRLGASYAFNLAGKSEHGDAILNGNTFDKAEGKAAEPLTNGTSHRSSASSGATSPAASLAQDASGAESETEAPDKDNPFDWRHYTAEVPSTTAEEKPKLNGSSPAVVQAATPGSRTASPLAHSRVSSRTQISSPSGPRPASSNAVRPQQAPAKRREPPTNPLRAPASNKRPRNTSAVSAPSSQSRPVTPAINVETPTPTTTSAPSFKGPRPHSHSAPQRPALQADPNELIIEGEDDDPPSTRRPYSPGVPSYMTPPSGRPMSLREAASRGASPLMPPRSRPAYGHSRAGSGALSGLGIKGLRDDTEVIDFGDNGTTGSRRSNGDVDTDLELGSPAFHHRGSETSTAKKPRDRALKDISPGAHATSPAYAPQSPDVAHIEDDAEAAERTRRSNTDELESALQDALSGGDEVGADGGEGEEEEGEEEEEEEGGGGEEGDQDLGDALAEALMAAGGDEGNERDSDDEESEAE
ncbi:MAG: hypothetical protein Q9159_003150 [Coniocarpon cinnabarinum]